MIILILILIDYSSLFVKFIYFNFINSYLEADKVQISHKLDFHGITHRIYWISIILVALGLLQFSFLLLHFFK